ncbi:hypothetical protein [uncultured Roseobacter sp.]|uniref:hypothetical protein n=1 Tax=uncultured Roseobacter sp. TaxID=114847 RepID=UPI00260CC236|nr:hypothetical protein [uncultured Roseobacter sp.]
MERALGWSQFIPIRVLELAGGSIPSNWYDKLKQRRKGGRTFSRFWPDSQKEHQSLETWCFFRTGFSQSEYVEDLRTFARFTKEHHLVDASSCEDKPPVRLFN